MAEDRKCDYLARWSALKTERESWKAHWAEISTYLMPRNGRYFVQDRNRGQRRHNTIYDNTGTHALNTLAAGMMAGMTSPARPWLKFAPRDRGLMKSSAVRQWLNDVTLIILTIFAKGNTYRALHQIYRELGGFGTAASIVLDDFHDVMRQYTLTAGEFCIAQNWRGETDTLYREFEKTVAEIVREFGYDACSNTVRRLYDNKKMDAWVPLLQAIEPRDTRDFTKGDGLNMAWRSCYLEVGAEGDKVLREGGYKDFPALAPRWDLAGGDIYGNSPGMTTLGDVKQLQQEQLRKSQGIDYMTRPPLQMPTSMKNREVDGLPGGVTYMDMAGQSGVRNLFEVQLNLQHLQADIVDVRGRINTAFYADLFLMLANSTNSSMTATEVAERHEEKLLMLGPVLERMNDELLNPLVTGAFHRAMAAGILPPPPPELHGMPLDIEYVSMLAQAQRAIGTNSIDRFVGNLGAIADMAGGAMAKVLDKFDADEWVDQYSDMLGVDPSLIVAGPKVALIRQDRAKQQAEAQQAALNNQRADTAQKLAASPTRPGATALTDLMGQLSGYGSPTPETLGQ